MFSLQCSDCRTGESGSTEMAKKEGNILLSNSCLVFPAVVKQQQEEISRNPRAILICRLCRVIQCSSDPGSKNSDVMIPDRNWFFHNL